MLAKVVPRIITVLADTQHSIDIDATRIERKCLFDRLAQPKAMFFGKLDRHILRWILIDKQRNELQVRARPSVLSPAL
jgi:hypothetical protein